MPSIPDDLALLAEEAQQMLENIHEIAEKT